MKTRTSPRSETSPKAGLMLLALAVLAILAVQPAQAATIAWNGTTDALWATGTNWSATPVPGTGDTATFNSAGGTVDTISLGTGVTINTILFDTASAAAYTIGTGSTQTLTLDNGGAIQINSTVTAAETLKASIVLGNDGTAQNFYITNNSATQMSVNTGGAGQTVVGSTGTGLKTLNLSGSINFTPSIGNGSGGGKVAVHKTGSGTVNLGASFTANTYTGGTYLDAGTLTWYGNCIPNATSLYIAANTTIDSGNSAITGTGLVQQWNGDWTYSGASGRTATFTGGTVDLGATGTSTARTLTVSAQTLTINSVISNGTNGFTTGLTKAGAGTLQLSNANSFSGGVIIKKGTLELSEVANVSFGTVGSGPITLGDSAGGSATLQLDNGQNTPNDHLWANPVTLGTGAVGTLTIAQVGGGSRIGELSGAINLNGNNLLLTNSGNGGNVPEFIVSGGITGTGNVSIKVGATGGTADTDRIQISGGNVAINGTITNEGTATARNTLISANITSATGVIQNSSLSKLTLSGTNTYTGTTTISAGTLKAGAAASGQAFGNLSAVTTANIAAATLNLNGYSQTIGSLAGGGATGGNVTLGANATLTTGGNNTSTSYAGVISGTGSSGLTKSGAGTLTLSGANTYTGATVVNLGQLTIANGGSINAASTVSVNSGATLALAQTANSNTLTLNGGKLSLAGLNNQGTGGAISYAGGNVIYTFTSGTPNLVLPRAVSANVLVVGGGGGGSDSSGGGGGAGGLIYQTGVALSGTTYAVTVGAGGAGGTSTVNASNGVNSTLETPLGTLTAIGGGRGSSGSNFSGPLSGGSGGGASWKVTTGAAGTSGQGNAGGSQVGVGGSGGGGYGSAGGSGGTTGPAGAGGTGFQTSISGTALWYAGGGGGGGTRGLSNKAGGAGGNGGGGAGGTADNGGSNTPPVAGTANTGGGGGGGSNSWTAANALGAAGGSGVVIVSYFYTPGTLTLSGTITVPITSTLDALGSGGWIAVNSGMTGAGGIIIDSSIGNGGVVLYGAANTYNGDTTVNGGATLQMTIANAMPYGSLKGDVTATGTLDLNGNSTNINGLSGSGIVDGTSGTPTLTVGNNDATSTFGGVIKNTGGTLALTKTGTGTLALSGDNTYGGDTTVSNGTLLVNGSLDVGSTVTVAGGATLGGTGTIYGATIISGHHTPGSSAGIQTFDGKLIYQLDGTADVTWELVANTATLGSPAVFDRIVVNGNGGLNFDGTTAMILKFNSAGSTVDWADLFWDTNQNWLVYDVNFSTSGFENLLLTVENWPDSNVVPVLFNDARPTGSFTLSSPSGDDVMLNYVVPEPATLALLGLGGLGLILRRKRR